LEKALTGKTVSVSPAINAITEQISGSSAVKDLETMLQLTYLYFTAPRRDEKAFETFKGLMHNQLVNRDKNPKTTFSDSIQMMNTNHSERTILFNTETLEKVSLDKAIEVYKARFANPADFTFLFVGNIHPEDPKVQELITVWLGGLKTKRGAREEVIDHHERVAPGLQKNYFSRSMETTTASNRIQYTSYDIPYTLSNDLNMEMIGRILSTRYLESIREREGGSYGVGTYGYVSILPVSCAGLIMQFDTDPKKQTRLMEIIHEEVQTIIENGPLANDLQKEKESMLKDFQENLEKNGYWRNALYMYYMYGTNEIRDYKAAVEAITAETVQQTLKKLVSSGNMYEVVMFPEN
jgi:zinc protease